MLGYSSGALAQQRNTVQCRSLPCPAVRCGTVRCCAVLCSCAVLCPGDYFTVFTLILLDHNKNASPAQLSPQLAIYTSQQRSVVRCRAVPCRALPCGAVLFHAALCFLSNTQQYQVYDATYQVPGTGMYVFLYSSFSFLQS